MNQPTTRFRAIIVAKGFSDVGELLRARPGVSLLAVADELGIPAIIIQREALAYAAVTRSVVPVLADMVARGIRERQADGWGITPERPGISTAFEQAMAFSIESELRSPWKQLVGAVRVCVMQEGTVPNGWLPASGDDPLLRGSFAAALRGLPEDQQVKVREGSTDREPGDDLHDVIGPIWHSVSVHAPPREFVEMFGYLPQPVGNLFASQWCQSEVCNGGFHQFFSNSTGVLAPEAVVGMAAIGLPNASTVVREAMAFLAPPYPRARSKRVKSLGGFARAQFKELDQAFYHHLRSESGGFLEAADAYARAYLKSRPA